MRAKGMRQGEAVTKQTGQLTAEHLAFINLDYICFELQQMKNEKAWFNLNIDRDSVGALLCHNNWYTLVIPPEQLDISKIATFRQIRHWQEIALALLMKYADRYYHFKKAEWEKDKLEYRELTPEDPNFYEE